MSIKKGLGRGLGALMTEEAAVTADAPSAQVSQTSGVQTLPISSISRNRMQPRQTFNEDALADLVASVKLHGVLQPLLVRPSADGYELIAGERRLRASSAAGLREVPVVIVEASDMSSLEIALIENLQRENLNPVEEAEGYRELSESFSLTQEEIALRVGKSRATVANALRLLALPDEARAMLADGRISTGHAKALLALEIPQEQILMARRIVDEGLSVRAVEKLIRRSTLAPVRPRAARPDLPASHIRDLSEKLHSHFGTSIRIEPCKTFANGKKGKGHIEIDFFSNDDLDRVLALLGLESDNE
ncbi:MAG TPA: chromosome partitioning protein ParB [Verrucomicrobia bacterium]|nr:chromosome partitioning protein ParB [Verrucomicrobiota bacterium]